MDDLVARETPTEIKKKKVTRVDSGWRYRLYLIVISYTELGHFQVNKSRNFETICRFFFPVTLCLKRNNNNIEKFGN